MFIWIQTQTPYWIVKMIFTALPCNIICEWSFRSWVMLSSCHLFCLNGMELSTSTPLPPWDSWLIKINTPHNHLVHSTLQPTASKNVMVSSQLMNGMGMTFSELFFWIFVISMNYYYYFQLNFAFWQIIATTCPFRQLCASCILGHEIALKWVKFHS